jgi:hypothetical protein
MEYLVLSSAKNLGWPEPYPHSLHDKTHGNPPKITVYTPKFTYISVALASSIDTTDHTEDITDNTINVTEILRQSRYSTCNTVHVLRNDQCTVYVRVCASAMS